MESYESASQIAHLEKLSLPATLNHSLTQSTRSTPKNRSLPKPIRPLLLSPLTNHPSVNELGEVSEVSEVKKVTPLVKGQTAQERSVLSVQYKRNILYAFIQGDLRKTCLPRLLGFLTWKDLLCLERVARWCHVAALSKSTGSMKRVPSSGYLSYFNSAHEGLPKQFSANEYIQLIHSACGIERAEFGAKSSADTSFPTLSYPQLSEDLTNFTTRELHLQQRSNTVEQPKTSLHLDLALQLLALSNDAFEHAWCANFAVRWPDLVEIVSYSRLCLFERTPVHASFFDSPSDYKMGDINARREKQIIVPSPKVCKSEEQSNGYMMGSNSHLDGIIFDAIAEDEDESKDEGNGEEEGNPSKVSEIKDILSSRSKRLYKRHTTWYVSTLASWRSLYRVLHEAEADHERSVRLPRSYLPEGNHFQINRIHQRTGNVERAGTDDRIAQKKGGIMMSPSVFQASDRFHGEAKLELRKLLYSIINEVDHKSKEGDSDNHMLSYFHTKIPHYSLLSPSSWPRPQNRTVKMSDVLDLEHSSSHFGSKDEVKRIECEGFKSLDIGSTEPPETRNNLDAVIQVAKRRAMASSLSPIHLLDSLLANLAKLNKSGGIPPPPIHGAIVSLTIKLATLWMRAEKHDSFEMASFAAVRAGMCQAHMIMSLPSYAKFALREWLIQQTRVRLVRDLPLTCAPPALLLEGHARVNKKKVLAVGSVFTVSPISANLTTPSNDMHSITGFLQNMSQKPPAALAVVPLCICKSIGFIVNRLASDLELHVSHIYIQPPCTKVVSSGDRHSAQIEKWRSYKPPPCECETIFDFLKQQSPPTAGNAQHSCDKAPNPFVCSNIVDCQKGSRRSSSTYTFDQMQRIMERGDERHEPHTSRANLPPSDSPSDKLAYRGSSRRGEAKSGWKRPLPDGLALLPFPLDQLHTLSVNL